MSWQFWWDEWLRRQKHEAVAQQASRQELGSESVHLVLVHSESSLEALDGIALMRKLLRELTLRDGSDLDCTLHVDDCEAAGRVAVV